MPGKLINSCHVYPARVSPALNGSSTLERFERSNASEKRNGIMFDFYPGLPHMYLSMQLLALRLVVRLSLRNSFPFSIALKHLSSWLLCLYVYLGIMQQ